MNTGIRISQRRRQLGLSQEELAHRMGTHQRQISRYETGENDPSGDRLIQFANALETTTDWLLGLSENPNRPKEADLTQWQQEMLNIMQGHDEDFQQRIVEVAKLVR